MQTPSTFLAALEAEAVQGWAMPRLGAGAGSMLHFLSHY